MWDLTIHPLKGSDVLVGTLAPHGRVALIPNCHTRTGSAVAGYCPLWAWLHSHQPARFCFWELTKQLPRVVTNPGIAPASNSLNFGVLTTPKPVSSQKVCISLRRCQLALLTSWLLMQGETPGLVFSASSWLACSLGV
ncbi:hypothetical protein L3X38_004909 [Prunus dulcis]|uniref:Uncharacterized protein n=1 Tax=Prunus dulcis TaxID=3755 RepID=A0AAD4ZPV4_PRUDU|nr:hypothetical protein L3X38_004909 [Prunus dulcis]